MWNDTPCPCIDCIRPDEAQRRVVMDYPDNGTPPPLRISSDKTPWAVTCSEHGAIFLTSHEYKKQLRSAENCMWLCPTCGRVAIFDEANLREYRKSK